MKKLPVMFYLFCGQQSLALTQPIAFPRLVLLPLGPRLKVPKESDGGHFEAPSHCDGTV